MNMNILGLRFLDKFKYILVYQKWANMNTNIVNRIFANTNTNKSTVAPKKKKICL